MVYILDLEVSFVTRNDASDVVIWKVPTILVAFSGETTTFRHLQVACVVAIVAKVGGTCGD